MNKPVAWGWYDLEIKRFFPHWDEDLMENKEGCIPLYTHPVKELTDEEIIEIANRCTVGATAWHNPELDPIEFAKAILRKAQEK